MKAKEIEGLILQAINQVKAYLLLFATFGIALLFAGWVAPRLGITFVRLPSAEPTALVYAAGIVWLLK
jgi:hypothetical protein